MSGDILLGGGISQRKKIKHSATVAYLRRSGEMKKRVGGSSPWLRGLRRHENAMGFCSRPIPRWRFGSSVHRVTRIFVEP